MSEMNKVVIKRWFDEFNKGKNAALAVIDEAIAPDYVMHDVTAGELHGKEELRRFLQQHLEAFPDLSMKLEDLIVEGDRAVYRYTISGTHRGPLMGYPPTNKRIEIACMTMGRLVNGKIAEEWQIWDAHGLFKQLSATGAARVA